MGMFDYVKCSYPLPHPEAQNIEFQSKDFECEMTLYEITAAGRLVEHHWEYEATPENELPHKDEPKDSILRLAGSIRRKQGSFQIVDTNYHGMFNFYGTDRDDKWFEYNAKFTDGNLVNIEVVEAAG